MCPLFVFFVIKIRLLNIYKKCFLFDQKSFCPRDIQILYSPLFSFLGHSWFYRRRCFMINSKVYFGSLHWQGDSLAYSMLITVLDLIWSKDHWEPWKEVGCQSLAKYIVRVWTRNLSIQSWCNGLGLRCWIPNHRVLSSKRLVGSKVDSAFQHSTFNGMSTTYSWGVADKE